MALKAEPQTRLSREGPHSTFIPAGLQLKFADFWVLLPRYTDIGGRGKTQRSTFLTAPPNPYTHPVLLQMAL